MKIYLSPASMGEQLIAGVSGDTITLNGVALDLSPLLEGEVLPGAAVSNIWVTGDIRRIAGEIHLTLRLPHGANAPDETCFPAAYEVPMTVLDGEVPLPPYNTHVEEVMLA